MLSHIQVCRDMELTVFNASAECTIGFAELHEYRRSDVNPSFDGDENLTRTECVTGCVNSNGDGRARVTAVCTARKDSWTGV